MSTDYILPPLTYLVCLHEAREVTSAENPDPIIPGSVPTITNVRESEKITDPTQIPDIVSSFTAKSIDEGFAPEESFGKLWLTHEDRRARHITVELLIL